MKNIRLAERLFNTPLMVTESKLNVILGVLGPKLDVEISGIPDVEAREVSERERRASGYSVRNGIAVIPVLDTLVQRSGWLDAESGLTSYESIRRSIDMAMDDDAVLQVVLDVDSPGGEVPGAFDLSDHIYQSRGTKKITSMINEQAASAGYLIASAASRVVITRTGIAGSVGVIATHADFSRMEDDAGVTVTHIYAGARKKDFTPHEPLSEEAVSTMQSMVDDTYELFVETVARNRGISKDAVRKTEAAVFSGQKAVAAGLADEVGAADKTMARLAKQRGGMIMPGTKAKGAAEPADAGTTETPDVLTKADLDSAVAETKQAMKAEHETALNAAVEEVAQKATTDERSRIMAVHAACKENEAMAMFGSLVESGADEEAAGQRIQEALVMRGEDEISSRHGEGKAEKPSVDYKAAFNNINGVK